ncbi:flagellar hook-basal body complex protein [Ammoniphilus sp. CFH 90114]|uniref:flagellar hook-basal body complex protein n=1 Tax=Ammoniphilus sp. CFH 90114 TaxID=2493665 RepID=UPI00100EC534|nr:flagellar hook-basal body complex protein [Ammoniphilus sp. CFH 90114]RXT15120.1 flagellar hook-basal body complex protein [Ammoniphilus sp. CFH 90114]
MIRSLYSGVSGMRGFQTKMDVIGNNIANVNTVGFKKSRVTFQDMLSQTVNAATSGEAEARGGRNPRQIGLGTQVAAINVIHTPGSPIATNVTTDLIINGDGFFAVKPNPDQEAVLLTRAGDFTRDATGNLVTPQGFLVLNSDGDPINIPPDEYQSFSIGTNGVISGTNLDGEITEITTIGVVMVNNPAGLNKVGGSLYEVTLNAHPEEIEILALDDIEGTTTQIISGQLEMSNVDLTEEFTDMIITQRGFQANSRIITTSDTMMEEIVNLKR